MESPVYRVVLTGDIIDGFSEQAVISALSRMFQRSAADVVRALDAGACTVEGAMGADEAYGLLRRFENIGAVARVEMVPGAGVADDGVLQLPPQEDSMAAGLMHCPACGHQQLVADTCDACGIHFAEYNRAESAGRFAAQGGGAAPMPAAQRKHRTAAPIQPDRPVHRGFAGQAGRSMHRDIHSEARSGWRSDWLDGEDSAPTEDYHINLFMGMRSGHLVDACQRMKLGRRTHIKLTWTWGAVISPFLWAMYRKMYLVGLIILMAEVVLPVMLISWGSQPDVSDKYAYLGFAGVIANRLFWPTLMKYLYCGHCRRTIMYLHRMSPTFAPDIDIATRGGTSRTAAFLGAVMAIVVTLLTWSIVDNAHGFLKQQRAIFAAPPTPAIQVPEPDKATEAQKQAEELVNENKWVATRNRLRILGQQVNRWLRKEGQSLDPATLDAERLASLLNLPEDRLTDGWGNKVRFISDGKGYRLVSTGPDGVFGNSDDVEYRRILRR